MSGPLPRIGEVRYLHVWKDQLANPVTNGKAGCGMKYSRNPKHSAEAGRLPQVSDSLVYTMSFREARWWGGPEGTGFLSLNLWQQ